MFNCVIITQIVENLYELNSTAGGKSVKDIKWVFVFYSLAALVAMAGIGISVGERSILGVLFTTAILCLIMGMGFKTKKKMRDAGLL